MKRRLLAMLLVFAMTLSVCPVNAFALDVPTVLKSGEIPFQVNPLYADVLEASDFDQPERKPGIPANGSDADYLTEDQVIDQVREAMKSRVGEITVHVQTTETDLATLAKDIFYGAMEHTGDPKEGDYLKWHWGGYNVAYGYYMDGGITYIDYSYNVVYYTTQEQEAELDGAIAELLASPELDGADDYEKIRFFYDYICNNIVYDYENLEDDAYKLKFSAYAAMVNGTAVCQGYAQLLYRLALSVGVDARLIAGIGNGGGHAWNIIRLDGLYYNVDSTWDAPRAVEGMEYEYFLTTDANFGDHARYEEYATESFYAEYPMGATNYVHQENGEPEPDIEASGTCGENAIWSFDEVTGTLTISGEGAMYDIDYETYSKHPWRDKDYQITHIVVEEGITRIGDYAFLDGCWGLESIQIADSVTSIGKAAFPIMSEGAWTDVEISENMQDIGWGAFRGDVRVWVADNNPNYCSDEMGSLYDKNKSELFHVSSLTQGRFTVPNTVKIIGEQVFLWCSDLTDIELPASLENVCQNTFMGCSSLIGIWIDESNPYYVSDSYGVVYTKDMTELYIAPKGITGSYTIPQTVTRIWWDSFSGCSELTEVILPDGITKIEDETFRSCYSLSEITIPSSVTEIDVWAFGSCGISKITFVGDAPAISEIAFDDVTATAYYPAGNKTWTADVMQNYGGTITWEPYETSSIVSGTCGENLTWSFDEATGVLTISGEGDMFDYDDPDLTPWRDFITSITSVVIEEGVTSVGDWAFAYCFVTSLSLPETLTEIGAWAFAVTNGLTSVDLPDSLVTIGDEAFFITALREVTIPASVETIGVSPFVGQVLTAIHVAEGNENYYSWNGLLYSGANLIQVPGDYTGALQLHDFTQVIGEQAMLYCEEVTELVIPASVFEIGQNAFSNCTSLTHISFQGNVPNTLAENLFDGMTLTVSYPDANTTWTEEAKQIFGGTVTWTSHGENLVATGYCGENSLADGGIGYAPGTNAAWTLDGDGNLVISGTGRTADCILFAGLMPWINVHDRIATIVVEEGITYVGQWSFAGNESITEAYLPSTLEEVGAYAFCYMSALEKVNLAEGITQIWPAAFGECTALSEIVIPESVTSIGESAFYHCTSLTDIVIPQNVQSIGDWAFAYCDGITAFQVDEGNANCYTQDGVLYCGYELIQVPVTYAGALDLHEYANLIDPGAFAGCTGVTEISITSCIREIPTDVFQDCTGLTKVTFRGNAPGAESDLVTGTPAENIFDGLTLTVSYPSANTSWTEDVKQAMGGTITWTTHGENLVASGYCGENSVADENGNVVGGVKQAVPSINATWTLTGDGTMTISGTGRTADCILFVGLAPWVSVCDRITKIVVEEGITYLGQWSFADLLGGNVAELSLPSTLVELGMCAFYVCDSLTDVVIPQNVQTIGAYAFGSCTGLTNVEIPAAVTVIGAQAFAECTGLTELRFYGNAPAIAEDALTNVTATAYYPASNATWTADVMQNYGGTITWEAYGIPAVTSGICGDTATWSFDEATGTLTISGTGAIFGYDGDEEIQNRPWHHLREKITKVVIEDGITVVGDNAFCMLEALETVIFSDTVTEIGTAAFWRCVELVDVTLPANLGLLGDDAFNYCLKLETIDIPATVYYVGGCVFSDCRSLTSVIFRADPNSNLGSFTIGNSPFRWCYALEEIQVEEGHFALRSVDGCLYSGEHFMQYPHGRQDRELVIAEGTKEILQFAFSELRYLEKITLPASMETIGGCVFWDSACLQEITFEGNAPVFAEDAFAGSTLTIRYPENDPTWTADVMQNYGGTITWVPYTRYEIIEEGTDEVVVEGEELTIHIEADHTTLVAVYLDGELVDPANYTVTEGSTIITFKPEFLATLGEGEHKVTAEFEGGTADATIKVQDYMPGDINGDGKVNNKDLTRLFQYLSNWEVEVVEAALDVNGDGKTNNKDLTRLFQYLSNWDVEIH